jgi:hypothetical protein
MLLCCSAIAVTAGACVAACAIRDLRPARGPTTLPTLPRDVLAKIFDISDDIRPFVLVNRWFCAVALGHADAERWSTYTIICWRYNLKGKAPPSSGLAYGPNPSIQDDTDAYPNYWVRCEVHSVQGRLVRLPANPLVYISYEFPPNMLRAVAPRLSTSALAIVARNLNVLSHESPESWRVCSAEMATRRPGLAYSADIWVHDNTSGLANSVADISTVKAMRLWLPVFVDNVSARLSRRRCLLFMMVIYSPFLVFDLYVLAVYIYRATTKT